MTLSSLKARFSCLVLVLSLGLASSGALAISPPAVEAAHGMVVSSQHLASEAGAAILAAGGNAVDAAVAVGYAEAVTHPCCGNLGGGGFMIIRMQKTGREVFINFRETAPHAATPGMFLGPDGNPVRRASLDGYRAVAVPGTVLGLETARVRYGTLSRARLMAPAIKLARDGFILTRADTAIIDAGARRLRLDPVARQVFFHADGSPLRPGERLRQPQLAHTLELIALKGPDAFYRGEIASKIAAAMRAGGGLITREDLRDYKVTEGAPLSCDYRGYHIISAPPPSSGGTAVCETLDILSGYDLRSMGFHSAAAVHYIVEAFRHAYMDRNTYLGDPAFVHNPLQRLLSPAYAAAIRARIDPQRATPSTDVQPGIAPHEKVETTHYSVVDSQGNAVSVTYTINGLFGAGVMAPGTGFMLNDEMDDFTVKVGTPNLFELVQGKANTIAPGKRPLSSMAPTIVTRNGHVVLVLGSPGGSRIISIVTQVILNIIDYGMQPQEAVDAPRIHHQWLPDAIFAEPFALSPDTARILEANGYRIIQQSPWGAAEVIEVAPPTVGEGPESSGNDAARGARMRPGFLYGANDDRRPAGLAVGY